MLRAQLNSFISDPDQNVLSFKIEHMLPDRVTLSLLEEHKFHINLLGRNEYVGMFVLVFGVQSVSSEDPLLQSEWVSTVNEFCARNRGSCQMGELLDECVRAFAELPDDDDELSASTPMLDGEETPWGADEEPPGSAASAGYDPFDSALMSPTALAKREQQERMLADHQQKQISKTMKNIEISNIIQTMKGSELTDHSKEADKTMICTFYLDGFTIDDGPLLSLQDPKNQKIIESFKQGFVPVEYSQNSREVDVHVIWEDVTHAEKLNQKQKQKQEEQNEVDDLFFQQQLAQIAEMERQQGGGMHQASTAAAAVGGASPALATPQRASGNIPSPQQSTGAPAPTSAPTTTTTTTTTATAPSSNSSPFSGAGKSLSSAARENNSNTEDPSIIHKKANQAYKHEVRGQGETTRIQFRIGSNRIVQEFNLDDTVGMVMDFVAQHPECPFEKFRILQSYPRRSLSKRDETLREGGLKNAALMVQRVE